MSQQHNIEEAQRGRHADIEVTDGGIATLTIVYAKSVNILSTPVIEDLRHALVDLAERPGIRVLVLRGTGDKAFVAGADIHEMAQLVPDTAKRFISRLRDLCDQVRRFPVPVICRIPGWTLGGGLELGMACDLRISSDTARFGMPEVAVGIPSVIHAALMPRMVGAARSSWMMLSGESIDAATALGWGLVDEVHALDALDVRIAEYTTRLSGFGQAVVRQQKRLLRQWQDMPLDDAVETSMAEFGAAFATGEPQAYMRRFLDRT